MRSSRIFLFRDQIFRFRFVSVHFETNLFGSVASIYIFGLFRFIFKQFYLYRLFQNTYETPKQTETNFKWFRKWTKTNAKQILFWLFSVWTKFLFYLFCGHPSRYCLKRILMRQSLKGTVSRDFFALVFFLNLFILVLLEMP